MVLPPSPTPGDNGGPAPAPSPPPMHAKQTDLWRNSAIWVIVALLVANTILQLFTLGYIVGRG